MRSFIHITLIIHIYIADPKVKREIKRKINIKRKLNGYMPGTKFTHRNKGDWRASLLIRSEQEQGKNKIT